MLDEALLAAVAAVAREGSFERAARVLHITPSAVSQRVKPLEEPSWFPTLRSMCPLYWQTARLEVPVLERLTRSVVRAAAEALQQPG